MKKKELRRRYKQALEDRSKYLHQVLNLQTAAIHNDAEIKRLNFTIDLMQTERHVYQSRPPAAGTPPANGSITPLAPRSCRLLWRKH